MRPTAPRRHFARANRLTRSGAVFVSPSTRAGDGATGRRFRIPLLMRGTPGPLVIPQWQCFSARTYMSGPGSPEISLGAPVWGFDWLPLDTEPALIRF